MAKIHPFPAPAVATLDAEKEAIKAILNEVFQSAEPDPALAQAIERRAAMADVLQGLAQLMRD